MSAHTLFDIARKLPEGSQVSMEAADGTMAVNAGRARFNLQTLPRDDFPVIAEGDLPTTFDLKADTLREIIEKTRFAISTEETRYYLNGIFFHVSDDDQPVLKAAATDGHRLARYTVARPDGAEGMPDIIVPRKCVAELHKMLDELDGTVEVALSDSKIRFGLGTAVMTSKLIDGTFPDYNRVIPTGNDKLLKIDPRSFEEGVDRVATIATEKTRAVKMALDNDKITLSVTSPENGTAKEEVPGRIWLGRVRNRLQCPLSARYPRRGQRRQYRSASCRRSRADADPRKRQIAGALCADADAGVTEGLIVAIISAAALIAASALSIYLTKAKERDAAWRDKQLEYYEEFFAAVSGIVGERPEPPAKIRFANAVNKLNLIASQEVIEAVQRMCDEIAETNQTNFSKETHDRLLSELTYAVRRDLKIPAKDDGETFSVRLWASGAGTNLEKS